MQINDGEFEWPGAINKEKMYVKINLIQPLEEKIHLIYIRLVIVTINDTSYMENSESMSALKYFAWFPQNKDSNFFLNIITRQKPYWLSSFSNILFPTAVAEPISGECVGPPGTT